MQSRGGWVLPSACFAMLCQLQLQTCLPPANLTALTMQLAALGELLGVSNVVTPSTGCGETQPLT